MYIVYIVESLIGQLKGETLLIPRMYLTISDSSLPFIIKRRQFPVNVAFAISINKCQGQTFDKVGLVIFYSNMAVIQKISELKKSSVA